MMWLKNWSVCIIVSITFAEGQNFDNLISGEHDNKSLDAVLTGCGVYQAVFNYKKEWQEYDFSSINSEKIKNTPLSLRTTVYYICIV